MKTRRKARQQALQAIYAHELSQNTLDEVLSDAMVPHPDEATAAVFYRQLIEGTCTHRREFDQLIADTAANWELDRIALLDRLILRQALCEFLHFEDIPPRVTLDEAIELAKVFGTDQSGRFINGLLDKLLHELQNAGRIIKTGRGLQEVGGADG